MRNFEILCFLILLLSSCTADKNDDVVNTLPKNGTIETSVKVSHYNDSTDLLITTHTVHKSITDSATLSKTDTIPTLGNTTIKDENGKDKIVKKDYDIYITVQ